MTNQEQSELKKLRFDPRLPLAEYDNFARQHQYCNILQSAPWTMVKAEWLPLRVGLRNQEGELVAAAQILRRPLIFSWALWYIPHGPLLDYEAAGVLEFFLNELALFAKKERCLFIRIHPPLPIREGSIAEFRAGQARELYSLEYLNQRFAVAGYQHQGADLEMGKTLQPRFQAVIRKEDWEEPPRGKIRYNLRQAERYFVRVKNYGTQGLSEFSKLIRLTEERQGIKLRNEEYFQRLLTAYQDDAYLALAEFNLAEARQETNASIVKLVDEMSACQESSPKKYKQLAEQLTSREKDQQFFAELEQACEQVPRYPAGILAVRYGRAADMPYAASDERFARLPAVWKLYVEGIRWAFSQQCECYNLGGLEGSFDDGLSTFKSHFNPTVEETAGEYDYPCRPFLYRQIKLALNILRKIRAARNTQA